MTSTTAARRSIFVGSGLGIILAILFGLDYVRAQSRSYSVIERHFIYQGDRAQVFLAARAVRNPEWAYIRQRRRSALEARGMIFRDDLIMIHRVARQRVVAPPQNLVDHINSWLDRVDPPVHAQVDCEWDPSECDDNGGGTTNYYYPFDDGNPDDSSADTEITDSSGSDGWEDITIDNTKTTAQEIADTMQKWAQTWLHLVVDPSKSWNGLLCSADGINNHINPAINDLMQHDAVQAGTGAAAGSLALCAGTGAAWFGCVGAAFLDGAAASIVANNVSFTSACHP
jgi:hypothetical protein